MRLDKFLKVSRIIKRRTVAKEAGEAGKIKVNGRIAKPGTVLKIGDIVEVSYFRKTVVFKVLSLQPSIRKEDAKDMFEIIEILEN
ncbi:MAG: RNA-binding S4 domain-containing protein [Bacilli bacterium]|jgi:ribosomal 50S subunit-recycling heat shock protein|nr:RNA-binding S4 domain-containing protein [Acholeplasmataceae bacterium]